MKKLKYPIIAVSLSLIVLVIFLNTTSTSTNGDKKSGVAVSATWNEYFENAQEMEEAADIIITGSLKYSEPELRENLVFTMNTIEILSVFKGDVRVGGTIDLLQTGGVLGNISTPAFSEIPLMEDGIEYILFLEESPANELYEQYYLILGGYQGIAAKTATGSFQAVSSANSALIESAGTHFASMMAEREVSQ